jgi:hypothetical protein
MTEHSFQGITPSPKGKVSPMCPVQTVTYVSGRSNPRVVLEAQSSSQQEIPQRNF